jgi:DJ-1 family protein
LNKKALVPIADGTEEMEAVIIIDMLRRADIKVLVVSDSKIVSCSRKVKIISDLNFDELSTNDSFDAIILPGGDKGAKQLMNNIFLLELLKYHRKSKMLIGAICAAPIILAKNKLLNKGHRITSHPLLKSELKEYSYMEENVVIEDNIITSRGAGTTFEFTLKIIELLVGKEIADDIAVRIVL